MGVGALLAVGIGSMAGSMIMNAINGGGDKDKTELTQKVRNALTTDLTNEVQNMNNILLKNIVDITNEIVNKAVAEISQKAVSANRVRFDSLIMSGNSELDIKQISDLSWQAKASQEIVMDTNVRNDLQTKIINDVINNTLNQNETLAKLNALNDILNRKTDEGGEHTLTGMVDKITRMFKSGSLTEKKVNQIIENELNIMINNKTINQTQIQNIIESKVKTIIENITEASCNQLMTTVNEFIVDKIIMSDNAKFTVGQTALLNAVSLCINTATNNVDIANAIIQSNDNFLENKTTNENKVTSEMDVKNTLSAIDEKTSVINGLWKALASLVTLAIIAAAIGAFIFLKKGGKIPQFSRMRMNAVKTGATSPPKMVGPPGYGAPPPGYGAPPPGYIPPPGYSSFINNLV